MSDLDDRIKRLEKRAQIDDERWQTLAGQQTAFALIFEAIAAPLCSISPQIANALLSNLKLYESLSRKRNDHSKTIQEFRQMREFVEHQMKKAGLLGGDSPTKAARKKGK